MPRFQTWIRQINLRERFFTAIPVDQKQAYEQISIFENYRRIRILLLVMLVWFSIMLALDFQYFETWQTIKGYNLYMIIDIILLLIILTIFFFFQNKKTDQSDVSLLHQRMIYLSSLILLSCIAVISSIEVGATGSIPTYLIGVFVIGTVFYISGLILAVLYGLSFVILLAALRIMHQDPLVFLFENISVLGIIVFAWLNSRIINSGRIKRFLHARELEKANLNLSHEMKERIKTENALQKAKNELERQVEARTQDLSKTVRKLEKEVKVRKKTEERLRKSLDEKEILIKEIYHRVKNNLQVIYSLLSIQSRTADRPEVREIFNQSKERIQAMALVHELLYKSEDLSRIRINKYIDRVSNNLVRSHYVYGQPVQLHLDLESCMMPIDFAVPFGLILNELIMNALKHAFPDQWKGTPEITVSYHSNKDHSHVLCVRDNGVGIAEKQQDKKPGHLGMQLVSMLAEDQLEGSLETQSDNGTSICITLPPYGQ